MTKDTTPAARTGARPRRIGHVVGSAFPAVALLLLVLDQRLQGHPASPALLVLFGLAVLLPVVVAFESWADAVTVILDDGVSRPTLFGRRLFRWADVTAVRRLELAEHPETVFELHAPSGRLRVSPGRLGLTESELFGELQRRLAPTVEWCSS